jgi:hypothetical protein
MTPKEKAKELFKKYSKGKDEHGWNLCEFDSCAKQCALIAVDEVIQTLSLDGRLIFMYIIDWWQDVKNEIDRL